MGGGSEAQLEVWRATLDLFSESFECKKKIDLVQISIQMWIYAVGGEPMRCHRLLVNWFLDKIKKKKFHS
jgi:hypothetical protein